MLRATALRLGYDGRVVLDGVSLELSAGESVAILGPNGAGKTTLLRAVAGLIAPLDGEVELHGQALATFRRRELARHLAYVPQEQALLFPFRVIEVVLMGRYARRRFMPFETVDDQRAAHAALEAVDLQGARERRFDELSGGERRRVLLAQALCQEAAFLLLDEPTASLDVRHARAFLETLRAERSRRKLGVLLATHDLDAAVGSCERAVLLSNGRVAASGPVLDLLASAACGEALGAPLFVGRVPRTGRPFCVPA